MKANLLTTSWIMLRSALLMAYICAKITVKGMLGSLSRHDVDVIVRYWAKNTLRFVKVDVKVFNPHHIDFSDNKRYIIMMNHSSHYDIPLTYVALPGSIRMVAKQELFRIPLFSHAMRHAEVVSIDRNNRRQAIKDLQLASERMASGLILWIAPEGTRSRTGKLGPLKKGGFVMAIRSGATIVPVGVRGAHEILPPKTWQFHLNQKTEIHIGEPIDASSYTLDKKEELMTQVESALKQLADIESETESATTST